MYVKHWKVRKAIATLTVMLDSMEQMLKNIHAGSMLLHANWQFSNLQLRKN